MNAGSYGKEMKDIIIETKYLDENGILKTLTNDKQDLGYRTSIFQKFNYIIVETKIKLRKGNFEDIENKIKDLMLKRKENQPLDYPSVGSTFKRGDGFITARLIEQCGLKGYSIGGAEISKKHAGFIINKGNATSKDILDLIEYTKKKVYEKFNVKIEEEVKII